LSKINLLAAVPVPVIEELIEAGSIFTIPPGRTVVEQGSTSAGLQVILEGTANVEVGGASRPPMGPGSYFGEISVIDGAGRSATITAGDEGLKTFTISPLNFMQLVDRTPGAGARAAEGTLRSGPFPGETGRLALTWPERRPTNSSSASKPSRPGSLRGFMTGRDPLACCGPARRIRACYP
jgi:hypothetical protein